MAFNPAAPDYNPPRKGYTEPVLEAAPAIADRAEALTTLNIRPLRMEDAPQLLGIERASFGSFHWSADSFRNELRNQLADYVVLEHTETGQLLGYAGYWLIAGEGHITTVAVHPTLRGLGLGEMLFTHLLGRAYEHQASLLTLEVRVTNYAAQNLYYKYGFQAVGKRPRYYQNNGEDALIMSTPFLGRETLCAEVLEALGAYASRYPAPHWLPGHRFSKRPYEDIIKAFPLQTDAD